jgi:hypothetical protein
MVGVGVVGDFGVNDTVDVEVGVHCLCLCCVSVLTASELMVMLGCSRLLPLGCSWGGGS